MTATTTGAYRGPGLEFHPRLDYPTIPAALQGVGNPPEEVTAELLMEQSHVLVIGSAAR
jgi:hypothetical protein